MLKKIFFLLTFTTYLLSSNLDVNDKITSFSLPDQFDKSHTINNNIKTIIISFEKDTGKDINTYLSSKEPNFLKTKDAVFIANISEMPSIITNLFALPKMRKYKHKVLLIYSENDKRFLQQEGKSTIYKIDNGVIQSISYLSSSDELEQLFN